MESKFKETQVLDTIEIDIDGVRLDFKKSKNHILHAYLHNNGERFSLVSRNKMAITFEKQKSA